MDSFKTLQEDTKKAEDNFKVMLENNIWHSVEELEAFVAVIKKLSAPDSGWAWARNWNCKYITLRIDMRDGGFILANDKERISLQQLEHQRPRG